MTKKKHIGILDIKGENRNPLTGEEYSDQYKEFSKVWSSLPAYERRDEIIKALNDNQVILITSGTGSGKTVLLPKYALHITDYSGKIAVTLPKKSITQSAAEYAAKTLDVEVGKEVGYKYRGTPKNSTSSKTKLLYATDGTIVAKLLRDPELKEYDVILVDEVHERKVQIDLLIYLLKNAIKLRPSLKIVFMSATVDTTIFADYFEQFRFKHIDVGGKTNYPITSYYLDKPIPRDLYVEKGLDILRGITEIFENNPKKIGGIIFFVTGVDETRKVCNTISEKFPKGLCIDLSARVDAKTEELAKDDELYKESGAQYKIIVATPVAESSLTVKGIKYVIDSGYEVSVSRDYKLDARVIDTKFISKAQVKQRMGRAGRTEPGICYHLYTKEQYDKFIEYPLPDILTADIKDACLGLLATEGVESFDNLKSMFESFIQPPDKNAVNYSVEWLRMYGLVDHNGFITRFGRLINGFRVDIQDALMLYAAYRLKCLREAIGVVSILETVNKGDEIFRREGVEKSEFNQAVSKYRNSFGDVNAFVKIYDELDNRFNEKKKYYEYSVKNMFDFKNFTSKILKLKLKGQLGKLSRNIRNSLEGIGYINNLKNVEVRYRVMASFMFAYRFNILKLQNGKSNPPVYQDVRSRKSIYLDGKSLLDLKKPPNKVMYKEMIVQGGKIKVNLINKVTDKIEDVYKLLPKDFKG